MWEEYKIREEEDSCEEKRVDLDIYDVFIKLIYKNCNNFYYSCI